VHDLTAITALGGTEPRVDSHGDVTCAENAGIALASLAARSGREGEAQAALARVIGEDAPGVARMAGGEVGAFWTGPGQWMVEAPYRTHEDIAAIVKTAVGDAGSVTEQTDGWVQFDLSGAGVLAALELLCILDTRAMRPGDANRTAIHHLGCFVLCRGADDFTLYGPRASAGSLHHAILTAMRSAL